MGVLTHVHQNWTIVQMRKPLHTHEEHVAQATELTGIHQKTAQVSLRSQALIARGSANFLAAQGGTQPRIADIPRRRIG